MERTREVEEREAQMAFAKECIDRASRATGDRLAKLLKKTPKRDPNAPKRGQSGFMIWLNANRKELTKPGMSVTGVAKAAGIEWKKVENKEEWAKRAAEDKLRYERQMVTYKTRPMTEWEWLNPSKVPPIVD